MADHHIDHIQPVKPIFAGVSDRAGDAASPFVSVCITTRARPFLLEACLTSLKDQVGPTFELLVCCQGDIQGAEVVQRHFPEATIGHVPEATPGEARNFLIQRSQGEWLLFLDDDVTLPGNLLQRIFEIASQHRDVMVIGGPNLTPPSSPFFEIVQGAVLGSILATGPVRRRYGEHPGAFADERYFTLCNLAVRREAMIPFPASLAGGEENAVLSELARQHQLMWYDPEMKVFHKRRTTFRSFASQMYKYGRGRGRLVATAPRRCRPAHFLPLLLLAWIATLPLIAVLATPWWTLTALVYVLLVGTSGIVIAASTHNVRFRHRLSALLIGSALCVTVHLGYASGIAVGIVRAYPRTSSIWSDVPALMPNRDLETAGIESDHET